MRSIRHWSYKMFRNERAIRFIVMIANILDSHAATLNCKSEQEVFFMNTQSIVQLVQSRGFQPRDEGRDRDSGSRPCVCSSGRRELEAEREGPRPRSLPPSGALVAEAGKMTHKQESTDKEGRKPWQPGKAAAGQAVGKPRQVKSQQNGI
ncbi:hypothetical protein Y1Q_0014868 [Alligator mississippiensis]|uniref:Uncharacterized protein n=1 Tax=Alligator mississippiensis TaxID=8496 RepID=A0A151P4J6_ALLMI|nr:hypothetical protein Y1Q_0014868 [Alligator mississippiensis]